MIMNMNATSMASAPDRRIPLLGGVIVVMLGVIIFLGARLSSQNEIQAALAAEHKAEADAKDADIALREERHKREIAQYNADVSDARERVATLEAELVRTKGKITSMDETIRSLEKLRDALTVKIGRMQKDLADATVDRDRNEQALAQTKAELAKTQIALDKARSETAQPAVADQVAELLKRARRPKDADPYFDKHMCADRGLPPGCTKPKETP